MTTNITQGNPVEFIAIFNDVDGDRITPSSASLTINYWTDSVPLFTTIAMTLSQGTWTGTWSTSSLADIGPVVWALSGVSDDIINPATTGLIRITD